MVSYSETDGKLTFTRRTKMLNIVSYGETGYGKSTFTCRAKILATVLELWLMMLVPYYIND